MKESSKQSVQFIKVFTIVTACLLALIALFIYIVDPFFQYRVRDKQYILNPIYNNPGIAKHYDYNTAIIGSSMVQNYNLETLRQDSTVKPVKLASGAMSISETIFLYSQTDKEKTNTYIINLDMIQFNEWIPEFRYPEYLFSNKILDRLRYHFAYESVVRYGLTDAVLYPYIAATDEEDIPLKLKKRYSIDDIGNFSLDDTFDDAEKIKQMYRNGQTVSSPYIYQMNTRIKYNIDKLFNHLEIDKYPDKEFIFVLPPYSALYWHITKEANYYHHLMNNVKYLCRKTKDYKNVRIQFFYNLEQITDLNRYSDVTHFDPATSDYLLNNLRNDKYTITTTNMNEWLKQLTDTVISFEEENADWL